MTNKKARSDEGSCLFSLFDQITQQAGVTDKAQ